MQDSTIKALGTEKAEQLEQMRNEATLGLIARSNFKRECTYCSHDAVFFISWTIKPMFNSAAVCPSAICITEAVFGLANEYGPTNVDKAVEVYYDHGLVELQDA